MLTHYNRLYRWWVHPKMQESSIDDQIAWAAMLINMVFVCAYSILLIFYTYIGYEYGQCAAYLGIFLGLSTNFFMRFFQDIFLLTLYAMMGFVLVLFLVAYGDGGIWSLYTMNYAGIFYWLFYYNKKVGLYFSLFIVFWLSGWTIYDVCCFDFPQTFPPAYRKLHQSVFIFICLGIYFMLFMNSHENEKRIRRKLDKIQNHLKNQEKLVSLGQLSAGIAHEINNPVNYISNNAVGLKFNFAELADFLQLMTQVYEKSGSFDSSSTHQAYRELETALLLKESEGLISGIQNGSRRISEVVKGMQYLSYSGENAAAIPTDIKAPIESALVIMANKLKEGIDLEREYGQTPPININPSQISQVILNLIDNAIQAVGEKGTINISSYVNGPFVCIAIKDNGIGISAEIREHIFDPFFTTRKVGEGTGLGLSISFGIIEAHGGKLEVDSLAGKGSEFIVKLPLESEFTQE